MVADTLNYAVRLVGPTGAISTLYRYTPNPPFRAQAVQLLAAGDHPSWAALVVVDTNRVVAILQNGTMEPIAGNGTSGYSGNGGPSVQALLASAQAALFVQSYNKVFISDEHHIRSVRLDTSGAPTVISTVFGSTTLSTSCADNLVGTSAGAYSIRGLVFDAPRDRLVFADLGGSCIRALYASGQVIRIAGKGASSSGYADGLQPLDAWISSPTSLALALDAGTGSGDVLFYTDRLNAGHYLLLCLRLSWRHRPHLPAQLLRR